MPRAQSEIDAVLRLLDETDARRADMIVGKVSQWQPDDLARLEQAALGADEIVRRNLEAARSRARFAALDARWREIASGRRVPLESALLVVAESALGGKACAAVSRVLDQLAGHVGAKLTGDRAFDVGLDALREVLHGEFGLRGNEADYYNPLNSYLPSVLERRLGIPISLSSVALLVAQRLDLPLCGIGMPGHFMCFYGEPAIPSGAFLDSYGGFKKLSRAQVEAMIKGGGNLPEPWMFAPVNEREIAARTIRNLIAIHRTQNQIEEANQLLRWLELLVKHGQAPSANP